MNTTINAVSNLSKTTLDRFTGTLLILTLVAGSVAAALSVRVGNYNISSSEIGVLLGQIAEKQATHITEIGVDLFSFMLTVILAAVLYVLFSPYNSLFALLGTLGFVSGGIILATHDIPHFVLTTIANDFVSVTGTHAEYLKSLGFITLQTAMWGLSIGITFLGLGGLFYSIVVIKSGIVHKALGWLGAVAGVLIAAGIWMPRFNEELYTLFTTMAVPFGIWQLALGLWLILRGTASSDKPVVS